jgi:ATP-dependent Clp protease ATP-binding subunit ClpA/ActR/RegA family two-component response regulator
MENSFLVEPYLPQPAAQSADLVTLLSQKVVGQAAATKAIVPYVYMYQSGLAPEGRPAGIFLLLGPTGTGKTKTVEAIAELLHGDEKKILKIDCGEFQMDHETAKLVGDPPGYLGHRETTPLLTQAQLTEVTSLGCDLALVLFDEIEKAARSITKLLLGILDKGVLRLGDNTCVDFSKSLIFFTSNLGAREMMKALNPNIGFQSAAAKSQTDLTTRLESIALGAVRKRFSPEFVNRIDAVVTYNPLDAQAIEAILEHDLRALQEHVNRRLGDRYFSLDITDDGRKFLLRHGASQEYGARELKRTIHRQLTQPLATMVARGEILPGAQVSISVSEDSESLSIVCTGDAPKVPRQTPTILIVDDNHDLVAFLAGALREEGWEIMVAENGAQARLAFYPRRPDVVLLDYVLGDDDGFELGLEFQTQDPLIHLILMTGGGFSEELLAIWAGRDFPVLYKPFLAQDVVNLVRRRLSKSRMAAAV